MKSEDEIKAALKQADKGIKTADSINEVKYWQGFYAALEWLNAEKKDEAFEE